MLVINRVMLVLGAFLFGASHAAAQSFFFGGWEGTYDEVTATATVTYYGGPGGDVAIPTLIVVSDRSFVVTRVGISPTVRPVFNNPNSLVTRVVIPSSVTNVTETAFIQCPGLTNITVNSNSMVFESIDGVLLDKEATTLLVYPQGRQGPYSIPSTVVNIWTNAFYERTGLTSVNIPDSVRSIQTWAFAFCTALTNLTIGKGLTNIDTVSFVGCTSLLDLKIPDNVTRVGPSAFYGCTGLTNVRIGSGVTSLEQAVFGNCTSLTNVVIPDNVTSIGDLAFIYCDGLTSVTIGSGVTNIGLRAFEDSPALVSILFKAGPPTVALRAVPTQATAYYFPNSPGWGSPIANLPTQQPFIPTARDPNFEIPAGFQFSWTNTGSIPMNVRRATSMNGPWTVVSTNNAIGQFVDPNPPSGKAFYQAYLP